MRGGCACDDRELTGVGLPHPYGLDLPSYLKARRRNDHCLTRPNEVARAGTISRSRRTRKTLRSIRAQKNPRSTGVRRSARSLFLLPAPKNSKRKTAKKQPKR